MVYSAFKAGGILAGTSALFLALGGCQEAGQTPPVTTASTAPAATTTAAVPTPQDIIGQWSGTYFSIGDTGYQYMSPMSVEIAQKGNGLIGKWYLSENGARWESPIKTMPGGFVSMSSRGDQQFMLGKDGPVPTLSAKYRSSWNGTPTSITVSMKKAD